MEVKGLFLQTRRAEGWLEDKSTGRIKLHRDRGRHLSSFCLVLSTQGADSRAVTQLLGRAPVLKYHKTEDKLPSHQAGKEIVGFEIQRQKKHPKEMTSKEDL